MSQHTTPTINRRCPNCAAKQPCTIRPGGGGVTCTVCRHSWPMFTGSLAGQAGRFATAITKHVATGAETRTPEEIAELLTICQECEEFYDAEREQCTHPACGCRVAKSGWRNKLRLKSQKCPAGKWE